VKCDDLPTVHDVRVDVERSEVDMNRFPGHAA
jgi:hypothetical protein